jgi:hypothetical protein
MGRYRNRRGARKARNWARGLHPTVIAERETRGTRATKRFSNYHLPHANLEARAAGVNDNDFPELFIDIEGPASERQDSPRRLIPRAESNSASAGNVQTSSATTRTVGWMPRSNGNGGFGLGIGGRLLELAEGKAQED